VLVDGLGFYVVEGAHHLLRDPDALVCIHRLDTPWPLAAMKVRYSAADERTRGAVVFVAGLGALGSVIV
jgi:hypothetical protein